MEGSVIFIKKKALNDANKIATSQNTLARMLMCNIFKEDALRKHSLTGKGQSEEKPGLPGKAINCILSKYSIKSEFLLLKSRNLLKVWYFEI